MEKRKLFLQLFTEGDDGGTGDGNGDGSGAEGGNNEPMSFDDFLAQEGNQAEFDRRVNKAIKTAVTKSEEKIKGKPPKAGTGGGNTITKEQIMDIKDPIERQKMIRENINLFQ